MIPEEHKTTSKKIPMGVDFMFTIYSMIKEGKTPTIIGHQLGMSQPNISYYLSSLKRNNMIRKIGYGTWEIIKEYNQKNKKKPKKKIKVIEMESKTIGDLKKVGL